MNPQRDIYNALCQRFGERGIKSLLGPCWDEEATTYFYPSYPGTNISNLQAEPIIESPYENFINNMEWFIEIVEQRDKERATTTKPA